MKRYQLIPASLVYGLVRIAPADGNAAVVAKYRDLTLTWSRYDYRGPVIEHSGVDEILAEARASGYRYCFIQYPGHILRETPDQGSSTPRQFANALESWAHSHEFLLAGTIAAGDEWFGLERGCMLVDLERHHALGEPSFDGMCDRPILVPRPEVRTRNGVITELASSASTQTVTPARLGWRVIAASLTHGVPVLSLDHLMAGRSVVLESSARHLAAFGRYLGPTIAAYRFASPDPDLGEEQRRFLESISAQASGARRGVFLLNIEPYDDVSALPEGFEGPVSTVYAVAAGFKPNMILESHGFDERTRVVFFDYSPDALAIRRRMVESWDGEDLPAFVEQLVDAHEPGHTLYQGWPDLPSAELCDAVRTAWSREMAAWGGSGRFRAHWQRYRRLSHEFVACDIMADPVPVLERIRREPRAVIWWSNAFFTMFANWHRDLPERQRIYESWMAALVRKNPDLFLYGADDGNSSVNGIRADAYWLRYRTEARDALQPRGINRLEIRT